MPKKKASGSKAKLKAEKKARTAQKVEKKEKKKAGKSKLQGGGDDDDGDQDLEEILDRVSLFSSLCFGPWVLDYVDRRYCLVDEKRMGGGS
jgi:hypothetical protein